MANYPPYYYQMQNSNYMQQPAYQQTNDTGIIWVQGDAGAKAYPVAAGKSVILMDTEGSVFYIKTVDLSGMPQPLRVFDFTERTAQNHPASAAAVNTDIVTRDEFEALKDEVMRITKGIRRADVKEGAKNE